MSTQPRPPGAPPPAAELPKPGVLTPAPQPIPRGQQPRPPLPGAIQGPGERW